MKYAEVDGDHDHPRVRGNRERTTSAPVEKKTEHQEVAEFGTNLNYLAMAVAMSSRMSSRRVGRKGRRKIDGKSMMALQLYRDGPVFGHYLARAPI